MLCVVITQSKDFGYETPSLTVDVVLFTIADAKLKCLLIRRAQPPFRGSWALPGGFVRVNESLEEAAFRELQEETSVRNVFLEQLYTFGTPGRDPRGRIVTVSYYALIDSTKHRLQAGTDADRARWFPVSNLPRLAFDHRIIVDAALRRLRAKANYTTVAFQLIQGDFTIDELQRTYSVILDEKIDRRNFRKKILSAGILHDTGRRTKGLPSRPGKLYRLSKPGIERLPERGIVMQD